MNFIMYTLLFKKYTKQVPLVLGDDVGNDGNSNPLCVKSGLDVGEIKSLYCDMFGRYVNIKRDRQLYVAEVIVNPETTGL